MKKALIYDLDNTIYSVPEVGEAMLAPLFALAAEYYPDPVQLAQLKHEFMRMPFQVVATRHHFSEELRQSGLALLQQLTYEGPLSPFPDYPAILELAPARYLVTTGFSALQYSKIQAMGIAPHFAEIHAVDPTTSPLTKKDIFASIMQRHGYTAADVLVVGDDPDSEIKAAQALGIDTVLYSHGQLPPTYSATHAIASFHDLTALVSGPLHKGGAC